VGSEHTAGTVRFDDLLLTDIQHPRSSQATDVSTIGYTSGTTGQPKGAVLTHRAVVLNTAMTANLHMRTHKDVSISALPFSHVYGNVVMNAAFLCGLTLVAFERFDTQAVLQAIQEYRATIFDGVPTMYYYMLNSQMLDKYDLTSLTRITVGGQTM